MDQTTYSIATMICHEYTAVFNEKGLRPRDKDIHRSYPSKIQEDKASVHGAGLTVTNHNQKSTNVGQRFYMANHLASQKM